VELEWGKEAYNIMWEIKRAFAAKLVNPDVILSHNANLHGGNLKPIAKGKMTGCTCIECACWFSVNPFALLNRLTLSPFANVLFIWREISEFTGFWERSRTLWRDWQKD